MALRSVKIEHEAGRDSWDYFSWGRNGAFKVHEVSLFSWGRDGARPGMYEIGFQGKRGVTNAKATITEADLLALRDMIDAALEGR